MDSMHLASKGSDKGSRASSQGGEGSMDLLLLGLGLATLLVLSVLLLVAELSSALTTTVCCHGFDAFRRTTLEYLAKTCVIAGDAQKETSHLATQPLHHVRYSCTVFIAIWQSDPLTPTCHEAGCPTPPS